MTARLVGALPEAAGDPLVVDGPAQPAAASARAAVSRVRRCMDDSFEALFQVRASTMAERRSTR